MPTNITNTIKFYRDCYRSDNRELSLWNTTALGEDCLWIEGEEMLANRLFERTPIPNRSAEHLQKRHSLLQREKILMYGVFFIRGRIDSPFLGAKKRTVCAPLLMYPAQIQQDRGESYVNLQDQSPHINLRILAEFIPDEHRERAFLSLPDMEAAITDSLLSELVSWIQQYTLLKDALGLLRFPQLMSPQNMQASHDLNITSSAAVMLVDRPKGARGILHELKTIAESDEFSAPLTQLFSNPPTPTENKNQNTQRSDFSSIPGLLSHAQKAAINIATQETLGLISGPPGTGKSYTIAATVADRVTNNETVLVVCETEQAIDVIEEKLNNTFFLDNSHIRSGEKSFLKQLKNRVEGWLNYGVDHVEESAIKKSLQTLKDAEQRSKQLEKSFTKRCQQSIRYGKYLVKVEQKNASLLSRIVTFFIRYGISRSQSHWTLIEQLQAVLSERESGASQHIRLTSKQRINLLLTHHRSELVKFNQAIRARSSGKQMDIFDSIDHKKLLQAFPIWLVTANTLHKVLPLDKELFDLVLIDEATQCNTASAIPALYRARRAIVVGDTKQLKHVSFLSKQKEEQLRKKNQVCSPSHQLHSYRDKSILHSCSDRVSTQRCVTMLDEHFRSKPDIIAFSNQKFYDNRLKVMQHRPETRSTSNIERHHTDGKRDKKGINTIEAEALINTLSDMVEHFDEAEIPPSIGIISPFRDQAEYIGKRVSKHFSTDSLSRHCIKIATPYGFQGEERDIMLLSFCVDDTTLRAASYLRKEDVFNVAITRARLTLHIFYSFQPSSFPDNHLLRQYLEYYENRPPSPPIDKVPQQGAIDEFQRAVSRELNANHINTWTNYPIAGRNIDLLCQLEDRLLAIDLIGFPGVSQDFFEIETYKLFHRANLRVFPLSYGLWIDRKEACIDQIKKQLSRETN